jgi:hypothetical protein
MGHTAGPSPLEVALQVAQSLGALVLAAQQESGAVAWQEAKRQMLAMDRMMDFISLS